VQPTKNKI